MSYDTGKTKTYYKIIFAALVTIFLALAFRCKTPSEQKPKSVQKSTYRTLCDSLHLRYGIASRRGILLNKDYFIIDYCDTWKIPYWVAYYLTNKDLQGEVKRQGQFRPDPQLLVNSRAELVDYDKSGFDRGHMAPAADFKRSVAAMKTTFLLSNMAPQTPALNRQIWQELEDEVRQRVISAGKAWIVTGNIFMSADSHFIRPSDFIGPDRVAVPTHCFKVVLICSNDKGFSMYGFLLPNQKAYIAGSPIKYMLTVDRLEQITGYDFFPLLDDSIETRLESALPTDWSK